MKKQLLKCLEQECKDCQIIVGITYCHYGVRQMEVQRGQECRHRQYRTQKNIPVYYHVNGKVIRGGVMRS